MIEFKGVRFRYDEEAPEALKGVDLTIPDGIFLVVAGHNGSGKSTLSKHINGLLLPSEGQVLVNGLDTKEESNLLAIRQQVGMVFQNPDNQLVTTIVEEDVAFGPENLGVPSPEIRVRVDEALKKVGMTASSMYWVIMITVMPFFRFSSYTVCRSSSRPLGSSMAVASSSTRIFGSMASIPAMAIRCFWPPESRWAALPA